MQVSLHSTDQRGDEILESIRSMFAEKGFDGASMQDLARAAGMSVGNFYRYFPSKAAIVEAMVMRELAEVSEAFSHVMGAADPMAELRVKLAEHIDSELCSADGPLWAEMSAAAFRKPEIARAMETMETEIKRCFLAVFAKATHQPEPAMEARFGAHVALIMMIIKASSCCGQSALLAAPGLRNLILQTVDNVLSEVSAYPVKG
jgi:AcrR family transcriptional regulator